MNWIRCWLICVLVLAATGGVALGNGRTPTITGFGPDPARGESMTVLVMGTRFLYVSVPSDQREILDVRWAILERATGYERLASESGAWSTDLEVYWGEPEAVVGQPVVGNWDGDEIHVRATVTFKEQEEGDVPWTHTFVFTVEGVNQPPTPVISGNLGTPDNPLRPRHAGVGVNIGLDAYESTVPGLAVMGTWDVLRIRGGAGMRWIAFGGGFGGLEITMQFQNIRVEAEADIILYLGGGLQLTSTTRTAYLAPFDEGTSPPPGAGNGAPTLTVHPASVTVAQGQTFSVVATATDPDGDTLAFVWTGLDNSTINPPHVTSERTSAPGAVPSTYRSTLTYPTGGIPPGSHQFRVQAFETGKAQPLGSPVRNINVVVNPAGGGTDPGFFNLNRGTCVGNNRGPELINIVPDPRQAAIQYSPGQTGQIELLFRDATQAPTSLPPFYATGIKNISWDTGQLTQRGITANTSGTVPAETDARAVLTFNVPSGATGEARVTVTASDWADCATTVTFGINFAAAAVGNPPQARIRYRTTPTGDYLTPPGSSVQTGARTIYLDAAASTGEGALTYTWTASGITGASLSSTSGPQVTLTIPQGVTGTVNVNMTARDTQNRTGSASLAFNLTQTASPPQASIKSSPTSVESGAEFEVEGKAESGGGGKNFAYQWTATTAGGVPLDNLFSSNARVRIKAPALEGEEEESFVTVQLTVVEDGVPSQPATVEIPVTRPRLSFSQVAVGWIDAQRRFETSIVFVNDSEAKVFGEMVFVNNEYDEDWEVLVDGHETSRLPFSIPPGGAREFLLTGDEVEFGWMTVTSNTPLAGHLFYRVVGEGNRILREVPILPVRGRSFRTALGAGAHEFVAVALVNLGRDPTKFRVMAREDEDPDFPVATWWVDLEPGEHLARYLSELYAENSSSGSFPPRFRGGSLIIEVQDPIGVFGATIIRTTEDGLPLSILPVATRR